MPEIKNQFTGGKMNQDLDERLVPNGEYREAMNIEVANSEASDVGTAQNILGNKDKPLILKSGATQFDVNYIMGDGAVCVGSISDEKNDTMYYLVWSEEADFIIQWDGSVNKPVFIDSDKSVLKFTNDMVITGINVIDGMLFWTDNINEPRKINIQRCIDGTPTGSNLLQTRLYNSSVHPDSTYANLADMEEKHITVVKKAPQFAPDMRMHTSRDLDSIYTAVMQVSSSTDINASDSSFCHTTSGLNDFSTLTTTGANSTIFIRIGEVIQNNVLVQNQNVDPYPFGPFTPNITPIPIIGDNAMYALTGWIGNPNPVPVPLFAAMIGKKVVFQAFDEDGTPPGLPLTDFALKGEIISVSGNSYPNNEYDLEIKITTVDGFPPQAEAGGILKYVIDLFESDEKLFEFKYPRFSYRYKYEDGEYSAFAPFTQVAFTPGSFDYHPRKGYNIGMTNKLNKVELLNFITEETPKDVAAIDVLFKDDSSPSVYVVDTIRPDDYASGLIFIPNVGMRPDNTWNKMIVSHSDLTLPQHSLAIEKEAISSIVPSNQLLRPWDNVPKRALAQDVSGNRVIYANYVQNYDLITTGGSKYVPSFAITFENEGQELLEIQDILYPSTNIGSNAFKSIKSLREYQLGVVFLDEYGRETPVISNGSGSKRIEKIDGDKINRFGVQFSSDEYPESLTHFKFFIKQTSSEYYNMAMDRWYSAGDGNVWLAFPSSDRNKIDIDTFLILKKGSDQDALVKDPARYKVLAIENEAPDFVKTSKRLVVTKKHINSTGTNNVFDGANNLPLEGRSEFKMQFLAFNRTSGQNIADVEDELYIEFADANETQVSNRYKINSVTNEWDGLQAVDATNELSFEIDQDLGADVNFIYNGINIVDGTKVKIYRYKIENAAKFDGRFFVKIYFDEVFRKNIQTTTTTTSFRVLTDQRLYSMDADLVAKHTSDLGNFLTRGYGKPKADMAAEWKPSHYYEDYPQGPSNPVFFAGGNTNNSMMQYGYYVVNEFAANALYFRRYREKQYSRYGTTGSATKDYGSRQTDDVWKSNLNSSNHKNVRALVHLIPGGSSDGKNYDNDVPSEGCQGATKVSFHAGGHVRYKTQAQTNGASTTEYWRDADLWHEEFGYHNFSESTRGRRYGALNGSSRGVTTMWQHRYNGSSGVGNSLREMWYNEFRNHTTKQPYRSDNLSARATEVWFIDAGPAAAKRTKDNHLAFHGTNDTNIYIGSGLSTDSASFRLQVGFGGILPGYNKTGAGTSPEPYLYRHGFWNVGDWNQPLGDVNELYEDNETKTFINAMNPGGKFKFKEDPSQQVYTIQGNTSTLNILRHSDGPNLTNPLTTTNNYESSTGQTKALWASTDGENDLRSMAELLSFNMSKRWDIQDIRPALGWDPTYPGIIPSGIHVKLRCVTSSGFQSGSDPTAVGNTASGYGANDLEIYVRSLAGTDVNTGLPVKLHEGMALTSYSRLVNNQEVEFDVGTMVNQFFIVREITLLEAGNTGVSYFRLRLGGWSEPLSQSNHDTLTAYAGNRPLLGEDNFTFKQVGMNGYSPNSEFNINTMSRYCYPSLFNYNGNNLGAIGAVGYTMQFVEEIQPVEILSENPAIFETEPKDLTELDIYYEASGSIPAKITEDTIASAFPIGTKFLIASDSYTVVGYEDDKLIVYGLNAPLTQVNVKFFRPDDLVITTDITDVSGTGPTFVLELESNLIDNKFILPWHNCYTFKNGVESNRIRDNFNLPFISNGVKASTTLEQEYKEEHRKYGLIYSGIYNSTSGINNLNQFIAGEKITKDVNPIYGSIQKLYSRNSDLVTLCEDKILRIQANKDALFNADGNSNVIATDRVLGQTIPFTGEYGISKNPESFASESYRAYFTDKVRGAVIRMSMDGLTPISDAGMKDYFRDNLKTAKRLLGSYDDRNGEYNLALNFEKRNLFANDVYEGRENNKVLTFSEKVGGWVSFKSFTDMQGGISLANEYYTFKDGVLFLHYFNNINENTRNTFYGVFTPSTIDVVLNQDPGSVKEFTTLNYEGSQSKVDKFKEETKDLQYQPLTTYNDQAYYNLESKDGWHVESITTNKEEGYVNEFLEKEGKWFNGINKKVDIEGVADTADFTFQGIGEIDSIVSASNDETVLNFQLSGLNVSLQIGDLVYARDTQQQIGVTSITPYGSEGIIEDKKSLGDLEGTTSLIGTLTKIDNSAANLTRLYIKSFQGSQYLNKEAGEFAMFSKYNQSMGHVLGYYAKVRFVNSSHKKAEMFSVGSEVIINSK